ncbi:hypothetical protein GPECTOR_29g66 [Gonium pectorale]|uniref:MIB/HERC2 domain-containing protein n=1 Tax=Gonium pectorale TaxID=33097 RepID=A0A150GG29_GONPE|nr:hypothetical protein GPECTOR_29g66 [Gonium pectorale]|eukprot:KXZ48290.1 hypothetical protein GPECTOR_29g66 [Gonium pectorale]
MLAIGRISSGPATAGLPSGALVRGGIAPALRLPAHSALRRRSPGNSYRFATASRASAERAPEDCDCGVSVDVGAAPAARAARASAADDRSRDQRQRESVAEALAAPLASKLSPLIIDRLRTELLRNAPVGVTPEEVERLRSSARALEARLAVAEAEAEAARDGERRQAQHAAALEAKLRSSESELFEAYLVARARDDIHEEELEGIRRELSRSRERAIAAEARAAAAEARAAASASPAAAVKPAAAGAASSGSDSPGRALEEQADAAYYYYSLTSDDEQAFTTGSSRNAVNGAAGDGAAGGGEAHAAAPDSNADSDGDPRPVVTSANARLGLRVVRGPDWDDGSDVDGGAGYPGEVVEVRPAEELAWVRWFRSGRQRVYALSGGKGMRELRVAEREAPAPAPTAAFAAKQAAAAAAAKPKTLHGGR